MKQFSVEKNIPVRSFTADETKNASGLNGPRAIADDMDMIIGMFDPEATIPIQNENGETETIGGGIDEKNLKLSLKKQIQDAYNFSQNYKNPIYTVVVKQISDRCVVLQGTAEEIFNACRNGIVVVMNVMSTGVKEDSLLHCCHLYWCDGYSINFRASDENFQYSYFWLPDNTISVTKTSIPSSAYISNKADKATTLSGYGITDAYTTEQVEQKFLSNEMFAREKETLVDKNGLDSLVGEIHRNISNKADKSSTLAGYGIIDAYTCAELDEYFGEQEAKLSKKAEETVLYEDVVNTPDWTNQPGIAGNPTAEFNQSDFYYVTLKDADGNPLPDGRFMLKDSYAEGATVYSTVFYLGNLDTGASTLTENHPVEFSVLANGLGMRMRDAGVASIKATIPAWSLQDSVGTLRTTVHGEFVPKTSNGYCYCLYKTDKNVASYHSSNGTTVHQTDNSNQIVAHAAISETQNKGNRIFDDCTIRRDGNGNFSQARNFVVRYSDKNVKLYQVVGYGTAGTDNIKSVVEMLYIANNSIGLLRNGTHIRITEVK